MFKIGDLVLLHPEDPDFSYKGIITKIYIEDVEVRVLNSRPDHYLVVPVKDIKIIKDRIENRRIINDIM